MEYLRDRGLSDATISRFRIGQLPDPRKLLEVLISLFGHRRTEAAGLLTKSSTSRNRQLMFPQQSLLFPFFENDDLVYLQVRLLHDSESRGRWRNLNDRKRRIYNIDAISLVNRKPIAICEGVMDALSAIELGYDAIGLGGVNTRLSDDQIRRLRQRDVTILFDWDRAGEDRAATLQQELRNRGIASTRKGRPSPDVKDVNDYLNISRSKR